MDNITKSQWIELRKKNKQLFSMCQSYLTWKKNQRLGQYQHVFGVTSYIKEVIIYI